MKKLAALLISTAIAASALGQAKRDRFKEADDLAGAKKFEQAAAVFGEIGDDTKLKVEERTRALTRQFEMLRNAKQFDDAIVAIQKQLALPADVQRQKQLNFWIADMQVAGGKLDAGISTLTELTTRYPDDADTVIGAQMSIGQHYGREKQYAKAAEAFQKAFDAMGPDDPRSADLLWNIGQNWQVAEQHEKAIEVTRKLLDERYRAWPRGRNGEPVERIASSYNKLKRPAEAIAFLRSQEKDDPNPVFRSRWCLRAAQTAQQSGDAEAARDAYRRLMIEHAGNGSTEGWWDAQVNFTDGLVAANKLDDALKHARLLYDVANDQNQITFAVQKMSDLLQKIDGNKKRAKDLVNGLLQGPNGRDGKPGTADDNKEVLSTIGYPTDAEREAAFAKAFAEIGDDAAAIYHRGQLCLYSGKPQQSLALFAEATRRAGNVEWATYAGSLVMNGLRATRGPAGTDEALKYLQSGEGDNPLKDLAAASSPWKSTELSAADKANVTAVMNGMEQIATDPSLSPAVRDQAMRGYARTVETLGVAPSAEPFYPFVNEPEPANVREQAMQLVLRLERGGELHVGKVKAFLAADKLPQQASKRMETAFAQAIKPLSRFSARTMTPRMQPMKD